MDTKEKRNFGETVGSEMNAPYVTQFLSPGHIEYRRSKIQGKDTSIGREDKCD